MAIEDGSLHYGFLNGTDAVVVPQQTEAVALADFDETPPNGAVWLEVVSGVPTLRGVIGGVIVDLGGAVSGAALNVDLLTGQDGGTTPEYTLTGVAVGDRIVFVGHLETAASIATLADVTSDFTVTADDEITDGAPTDYSNDQLLVIWTDRT